MIVEYIALNLAIKKVVYLIKFMKNLLVVSYIEKHVVIMLDNTSAIAIPKDLKCHFKAKHIK